MKHLFRPGGRDRHFAAPDARRDRGRHGRRPFDYGDLRLIVLGLIADTPRHGYELIKEIEARMGGGYSPSPGVIYPTLSWLEYMGYATSEAEGRSKSYRLTEEGAAFLRANREALDALSRRMGAPGERRRDAPEPVMAAMGALKQALRARFQAAPVDAEAAERIAAAIRAAAREVEKERTEMSEQETGPEARLTSTATVETAKAAGYAAQLAKHFAHKIPARFEDGTGEITFSAGTCRLEAEGTRLTLTAEAATPEALGQVEDVVARHLLRFAFREELALDWRRA